ncbi:MAG: hypothetical protein KDA57_17920 [Planctomycetales bacterium]|nr:hypothetical protein [Planctomycetales bacterium]MCA9232522.1 hypothetical protein [Planctomycetales bacterium]MCA9232525.1 hypothetical protein [Planctomycetales bacterium]MCA9232532.1 hypothetical protein [Planctomycetales bacterium]
MDRSAWKYFLAHERISSVARNVAAAQRRIERPMAGIISGNIEACPIGPL